MKRTFALVLAALLCAVAAVSDAAVIPRMPLGADTAPTLGTCGTATLTAGSSDAVGEIVITGGTPGACTVNFGQTYGNAPFCHLVDITTANANGGKTAATTTAFTYTIPTFTGAAANLGTDTLRYFCVHFK